jgi:hypothetical protein
VTANPYPDDRVAFENSNGSVIASDADRPILWVIEEAMEMKRGMKWIRHEMLIGLSGLRPNGRRKLTIELSKSR